jgi:hypothetical protein
VRAIKLESQIGGKTRDADRKPGRRTILMTATVERPKEQN